MNAISQIIQEAIHPVNLPLTWLLALSILYWLLVILGCFGDSHGDADAQGGDGLHHDADISGHGEIHDGVHHDSSLPIEGSDHGADVHPAHSGAHFAEPLLRFLHIGDMPVAVVISIMALFLWFFALLGNHYLNPNYHWWLAGILLLPNLLLTGVVVHYLAYPVKLLFQAMNRDADAPKPIVGSICKIITPTANSEFGEAIIETKGAPIQIHVRTSGNEILNLGQHGIVISENKDQGTFNITGFKKLQLELEK